MEYLNRAKKDFLTGCYAKEEFNNIADRVKAECDIEKKPFAILVLDLDRFKSYNDKYGHLDGDDVLKYFTSTLKLTFEERDCIIIRFGGDEFILIFPGIGSREAHLFADRVSRNLRKRPFLMRNRIFKMHFSGGISSYPKDGVDSDDLLHKADKAMYYSKAHGRGKITCYEGLHFRAFRRLALIILAGAMSIGLVYYLLYLEKHAVGAVIARLIMGFDVAFGSSPLKEDIVYLKSGRILKGRIWRETEEFVDIKAHLARGEGVIVVRRSDIERIEKDVNLSAPGGSKK